MENSSTFDRRSRSTLLYADDKSDFQCLPIKEELVDSELNNELCPSSANQNFTFDIKESSCGKTYFTSSDTTFNYNQSTSILSSLIKNEVFAKNDHILRLLNHSNEVRRGVNENEFSIAANKGERFGLKALKVKLKTCSSKRKQYVCNICYKIYEKRQFLDQHRKVHLLVRPYACKSCNKCFSRKLTLDEHNMVHISGKPYKCDICDERFTRRSSLKAHKMVHSGEKPFKCDVCDKKFARKDNLNEHRVLHMALTKPFLCEVCNKAFKWRSSLKAHTDVHKQAKQYTCTICRKSYTWKSSYKAHLLTHLLVKQYSCLLCNKKFVYKQDLNKHMKEHLSEAIKLQF